MRGEGRGEWEGVESERGEGGSGVRGKREGVESEREAGGSGE